ncbi:MAG: DUF4091 domain-containing protein [Ruminococcaceae bacterium]|nr:DUF4091 domain-containing protein [Oscillospiraceae bacterium]
MIRFKCISALEKCFWDEDINQKKEYLNASVLKNDKLSFQICFSSDEEVPGGKLVCNAVVESEISDYVRLSSVHHVPSLMPVFREWNDDNYLRKEPGLYPDLLIPLSDNPNIYVASKQLNSLWVDIDVPSDAVSGEYDVTVRFIKTDGEEVGACKFTVKICNATLPKQKLIYTQWFHSDCLANYYNVDVFSEKYWEIVRSFIRTAVENGINMMLTPVFTPALDTAVGHERLTVQLVQIKKVNDNYYFDFSLLEKWIDLCSSEGIEYFEIAHFFTQWGAAHAPKIVAEIDGKTQKIFGWETDACCTEYVDFLNQFIKELRAFLSLKNIEDKCVFHISDEPSAAQLESYKNAKNTVAKALSGCKIIDALSNYEFYSSGVVDNPVVATDHIQPFIDNNVENLWTYYCCGECVNVSNRFLSMPSARNRIIGLQMFRYNIKGFLHWGYNFYNNQYSIAPIDPYRTTDGEFFAPSGDTFSVYPAPGGKAYETIHLCVFTQALRDIRALEALADKIGRDAVNQIIDSKAGYLLTFSEYPKNDEFILELREQVNNLL